MRAWGRWTVVAALFVAFLGALVPGWHGLVGFAQSAGPAVSIVPASGPAGTTVSISATGYPLITKGSQASITFDGTNAGSHTMTPCASSQPAAGFGADCNGYVVSITVPASAGVGVHLFTVCAPLPRS